MDTVIKNVRYLVLNAWYNYPTEMELYGSYTAPAATLPVTKKKVKLKDFFGVNAYEWNFENPVSPSQLDAVRTNAIKHFSAIRHYMDWEKLESKKEKYTYNPVHSGGWNYDTMYQFCKDNGILVLADLKTLPGWMMQSYPENLRDAENTPVMYGKDFTKPESYIEQAKVAFQFAARYGYNKNIDSSLVTVDTSIRWTGDAKNIVQIGMGFIKYIECDNERDKYWKGRKAYQTGREYAANMSAFYDAHLNTMGPGVGVKNADPGMMVVMGGTASFTTDYVRGMIDWCKQYRGYKKDGTVNYCWDVINYHFYCTDQLTNSLGYPTTGVAPELSYADTLAINFVQATHLYAADMPVWVTESGYDDNIQSPYHAIPIGNKSKSITKADWILRTALMYARSGIQKLFFYQELDDNTGSPAPYATSGLIYNNFTRKPAANYIHQVMQLFGDYSYVKTTQRKPFIDVYKKGSKTMYVVTVGDQTGKTLTARIHTGKTASSATVYTPTPNGENMKVRKIYAAGSVLTIKATETPQFVLLDEGEALFAKE